MPSHDTLGEVIAALDPELFKACFAAWVEGLREAEPDLVAIDGKTSRRTHARCKGRDPLHLVSAWAARQRLVLGQEAVSGKSNEITAIPLLLERLALEGALVTIDAIGTQTGIAATILRRGGDYLLALKENRPATFQDVEAFFADPPPGALDTFETTDGGHGRIEVRRHAVRRDVGWLLSDRRQISDQIRGVHNRGRSSGEQFAAPCRPRPAGRCAGAQPRRDVQRAAAAALAGGAHVALRRAGRRDRAHARAVPARSGSR